MAKAGATEGGAEMINMALKSVIDVINEIRSMSRSLIPHTLKDLGLVDSVNELIESIGHAQPFAIQFVYDDFEEQGLPENQKLTLFRIIQEQLNNIVKYAGAKEVSILLKTTIQSVVLQISDDGRGFDERKVRKGLGFTNIRNRAELFGGKAEISSVPGSGCTLQVSMPVTFSRSSAFPTSFN
jgi:signal transduction histidine kinase